MHVLHHADDAEPDVGVGAHAAIDRILVGPVLLRHRAVDDDDELASTIVAGVEESAFHERDVHRLEVVWRHLALIGDLQLPRLPDAAFDVESVAVAGAPERNHRTERRMPHAWRGLEAIEQIEHERDARRRGRVIRSGERNPERQQVVGVEARLDARQLDHAVQHQPRRREQNHGERDLRDHQRAARAAARSGDRSS